MGKYKDAFGRLQYALDAISERYGCYKLSLYLDAMWANIRYGVTPNEYIGWEFYAKSGRERKTFYTARDFHNYEPKLNAKEHYHVFWDKQKFNEVFKDFIGRDWLYVPDSTKEDVDDFLAKHDKVIVKPTSMSSGKGIHVYAGESYEALKSSGALIEDCIKQVEIMALPNPSSVNSIRVYTMLDRDGAPHILSACMRVGGAGSTTDNFHSGGVAYPIDTEFGVIVNGGGNLKGERYYYHPGTNFKMIGFEIPRWSELVDFVNRAATLLPMARMIAWDVAITESGFAMIEGNYNGDPGIMQTPMRKGCKYMINKYF